MPIYDLRGLDETMASEVASLNISSIKSMRNVMDLLADMLQANDPKNRMTVKDKCALAKYDANRFVLSAAYGWTLQYTLLYLASYDSIQEKDLKNFRQWGSRTLGHPNNFEAPGIEITTGPLGQGIANAVGLALAKRHLAPHFNKPNLEIVDHYTYLIMGDEIVFTEDVNKHFKALRWHVISVKNGNTRYDEICAAIKETKTDKYKPSLIKVTTTIGFGSPNMENSHSVHGSALGAKKVDATRKNLGRPYEPFHVPKDKSAQLARRHAKPHSMRSKDMSIGIDDEVASNNEISLAASESASSNALVLLDPPKPTETTKEHKMINLLSIVLSTTSTSPKTPQTPKLPLPPSQRPVSLGNKGDYAP
ncbi:hypothetical protein Nepgr_007072 [Nepenthes gracilis]|uniref:Transketolase N-terminal domain-containing protein n=1 Tax=Nepenthes gracilis TaxID=150966 RepID=A0AAD3XHX7_NEPGR|nr:hypothetical protein Nepgr_007072 [Nepenthes gracilis]